MLAAQARAGRTETAPQNSRNEQNDETFNAVKKAVMAKLGGQVDVSLVDAVLKRVLGALK